MTTTRLDGLEPTTVPLDSPLHSSQRYLAGAYDAVASLIEVTYPTLRDYRGAPNGTLTQAERDLFRAAIVFAGAGVDTVLKEIVRSTLRLLIAEEGPARSAFLSFSTRYVRDAQREYPQNLAALLIEKNPHKVLRELYVEELTSSSLQSESQVKKTLGALGLPSRSPLFRDASSLNPLFRARHEIAHEMDMTPSATRKTGAVYRVFAKSRTRSTCATPA